MITDSIISPMRRMLRNCSRVQLETSRHRRIRQRQVSSEVLESRAMLSAVAWDGGAGTLNWADAANWDTDTVPGAADDVTIDIAGDNTINVAGTFAVGSFFSQESIYISGGQLTTNASSTVAGTFGMRADTTFIVDGVGSIFTAPATTHWELGNLTARNGAVIDLSSAITASNGFDGAGTRWLSEGTGSRIDLSGLPEFSGYGRNGQLVIQALDGGAIDLSGASSIPSGTTQMSSFGSGSAIDISAVETWVDGNRQRSSTVSWGDGGIIDVSSLEQLIGIGAVATNGSVMTFPAVTRIGGNGDSTSNSRAEGFGSRLEFPAATTMDGPDRHGENAFRAIDGGVISLPVLTTNSGGTTRIEAFGTGSEIDVSALTFWNDTNFARSSNVSWGDGGNVRVDSLETLRGVGVQARNGNVLTFPALTQISGGGDSSSSTVADGVNSRIEFPVLAVMDGPDRHGENSFQALNGGVISMPVLTVHTEGTTRIEAFGAGSEIDVSSLQSWTDNNRQRSSNLSWGDGGLVKVDSLQTLNSVSVTATAGNVMTFPVLTRVGGVGDSTGIHMADGEGSRLEYPAVTVVDGPDRHGDTSFHAENGGFIDLPVLTSVEHGAVSMAAFDTDGNGTGSEISVPQLATWNNNNRHRDSAIRYGRGASIDFASLTSVIGVSIYAADGDTVTLPVLETYSRSADGAPRLTADGADSRLELPVLTSIEGGTRNGWLTVYAGPGATVAMSAVTSISGGPTLVTASGTDSNVQLNTLESWTLSGSQPQRSIAQSRAGGDITFGTTTVTGIAIEPNAGSTITAETLTLHGASQLSGDGTFVGNVTNAGLIRPDDNASNDIGTLTIDGDFFNTPDGTLFIGIGGTAPAESDLFIVTGTATLDGTLDLALLNGFAPIDGDTFTVLEFAQRICDFHTKTGTDLGDGLHLAAAFGTTSMTLLAGSTPDPGQQCTTPPELTIQTNSVVAGEGATAANSGTFFDLEGPAVFVTASIGTIVQDNVAGTWSWSFDTLDGPEDSQTVTITATDSDGDETSATFALAVSNVAPTVGADSATVSVDEGAVASNIGTFADVGQDTVSISASVGTVTQDDVTGTWDWNFDTLDGPEDSQTVTITATDSDGAATETSFALAVNNVAPTVGADSAIVTVDEGAVVSNTGTFADVGQDTVSISASVGTVTQDDVTGTWDWNFDTLDGPEDSQTVTITATDSDGAATETTFALAVNNVAPTVGADSATVSVDEGAVVSNTGTIADVGQDTVSISASVGTVTHNAVAGTWNWSFNTLDGPDDSQVVTITATDSDGALTATTFELVVDNVAPTASLDGLTEGSSGDSFVVTATTQDAAGALDPLVLVWNVTLDGQPFDTQNGGDSYNLNDANPGVYLFTLTVNDGDGGITSATHTLEITADNQPPQLVILGPARVVRGHSRTFIFSASDPDLADASGPFEYTIDWGDGSAVEIFTGGPELLIDHTFLTLTDSSGLVISATVSDSGQLVSPTQQMVTHVTRWDVIADPLDASQTLLIIGGSSGDDFIKVRERRHDGRMRFRIHECDTGFASHEVTDQAIDRVLVYGQEGNDWIHVAQNVDAPTMLDGGDGDDTLVGGRGQSILLGQAGNDWLFGGYGRGLLIGGTGADRIFGWNRSDILIGGYTSFDNDLRLLDMIMQEWTSDRTYSERTTNLMGTGTGPRSNGTTFLRATSSSVNPATVFDDDAKDRLWGFRGADWYFANVSGSGIIDHVFGERWWEVVTDLDRE